MRMHVLTLDEIFVIPIAVSNYFEFNAGEFCLYMETKGGLV